MSDWDELKKLSTSAYEFLKTFNAENFIDGRHNLVNGVYINIESYSTQLRAERQFEAHKKYIDVQYMISGQEIITVCPVNQLECIVPYDSSKDITFYEKGNKGVDKLLTQGQFLIFKPGEGHMPCICVNKQEKVRKAVIKIPCSV